MAYKALYRTYRPQKFEEVIGQETVVRALENAISTGKTTHAYLFSGPRGTGKTTVARIFAKALNCEKTNIKKPCCECDSCKEIAEGSNPNVIEIDAASNNGVDEIRDIREKAKFLPAGSKYKIYIIDEVHMLSTSAFNALLKILEEPPKHVVFVLATTEAHKVLPTILSRCQRYDFKPLSIGEIKKAIGEVCSLENIAISSEAINNIAISAEGGMRDAYSILDQAIALSKGDVTADVVDNVTGRLGSQKTLELVNAFENKDITLALKTANELLDYGKEVSKIVVGLLDFYKDVLIYKNVKESNLQKDILQTSEFKDFANKIETQKIFFYVDILSDLQNKIRFSTTPQIYLEVAIIKMINISNSDLDFANRLTQLEQKSMSYNAEGGSNFVATLSEEDLEKINLLEGKVDNIIEQLAKMDIPGLKSKVQDFESSSPSLFIKKINELIGEISKVKEDVALIKVTQDGIQNAIDNTQTMDISEASKKLEELEGMIKKSKANIDYHEIETFIERKLDYLEEEKHEEDTVSSDNVVINEELESRLKVLEENTYKLMSGAFKAQNNPVKRKPTVLEQQQMMLFGDGLIAPEDVEVENEKVDFEELSSETSNEEIAEVVNETTNEEIVEVVNDEIQEDISVSYEEVKEEVIEEETTETIDEEDLENVQLFSDETEIDNKVQEAVENYREETKDKEEINLSVQELNPFKPAKETVKPVRREKVDPNADLFAMYSEQLKNQNNQSIKEEVKDKVIEEVKYSPAEEALNKSVASLQYKRTANSELVRGERKIDDLYYHPYKGTVSAERAKEIEPVKEEVKVADEYSVYDVKVLERILNDSRTDEGRNEKARITNLWRYLPTLAPSDKRVIAEILGDGVICAVGKNEFVISYPSSSICNQVMSKKFKKDSLKLLYDMLDVEYNYLALPDEVWHQKRTEYVNQYNIGIKYPKLSPFNNPELVVSDEAEEKSEGDLMFEKAKMLFGDNLQMINKEKK